MSDVSMKSPMVMRVSRPTDNLDAITNMYAAGLGFTVLDRFTNHDGFDGVILGPSAGQYHIEFTTRRGEQVRHVPTPEHLLVFYITSGEEWEAACARMVAAGFRHVPSSNPYWDIAGKTFEDIDRYRVVLQNAAWNA
jgi:prolyl oligopeptidase